MLNYCSDSACMGTDTWMVRYEDGKAIGAAPRPSVGEKLRRTKKREDQKIWDSYAEQLDALRETGDKKGEAAWWEKLRTIYGTQFDKAKPKVEKAAKAMAQEREEDPGL